MDDGASKNVILPAQLYDLPEEVILKLFGFLPIKELLICGQVSKRLQAIANDESLWIKLNLIFRKVPFELIEKAARNNCQYLSLAGCEIIHLTGRSESSFNVKYLNLSSRPPSMEAMVANKHLRLSKLVQNCRFLQNLSLAGLQLDSDDINYISRNSQTLKILDLQYCDFHPQIQTELIQDLFTNCVHLTELNIRGPLWSKWFLDPQIQALVDNLTPTILKVALGFQNNLKDEHVKTLVKRCNNITHLDLSCTSITNDSVQSIIKYLETSLVKLNVDETNVDFAGLLQLKSMPALKALICFISYDYDDPDPDDHNQDIENLKQQLPHIRINEKEDLALGPSLHIAKPFKKVNESDADKDCNVCGNPNTQ